MARTEEGRKRKGREGERQEEGDHMMALVPLLAGWVKTTRASLSLSLSPSLRSLPRSLRAFSLWLLKLSYAYINCVRCSPETAELEHCQHENVTSPRGVTGSTAKLFNTRAALIHITLFHQFPFSFLHSSLFAPFKLVV